MDYLGVQQIAAVMGGSMGGMVALEWPLCYPVHDPHGPDALVHPAQGDRPYIRASVVLASAARHSAWCIAWSQVQRYTIETDACFDQGRYLLSHPPRKGLAAARMCAMMTYRQPDSFERRFQRKRGRTNVERALFPSDDEQSREQYAVHSYLHHHGEKFLHRFDANCYIHLTRKLDTQDVARGRHSWASHASEDSEDTLREVLRHLGTSPVGCRLLVLSVTSDELYRPADQELLHTSVPSSELVHIQSTEGHDGFLLEFPQIKVAIHSFLVRLQTHAAL